MWQEKKKLNTHLRMWRSAGPLPSRFFFFWYMFCAFGYSLLPRLWVTHGADRQADRQHSYKMVQSQKLSPGPEFMGERVMTPAKKNPVAHLIMLCWHG